MNRHHEGKRMGRESQLNHSDRAVRTNTRSPSRLLLEPLEARRLLAGLQVSVFVDQDGSRDFQPTVEAPAPNRIVYIDLNNSGTHEPNEPTRVTGDDGLAFFEELEEGDYSLGILTNPISQRQTTSTTVQQQADQQLPTNSERLLADQQLQNLWSVDSQGVATNVLEPLTTVDFRGPVAASRTQIGVSWLAQVGTEEPTWYEFNLETGEKTERAVVGLDEGQVIHKIARSVGDPTIGYVLGNGQLREVAVDFRLVTFTDQIDSNVSDFDVGSHPAFDGGSEFIAILKSDEFSSELLVTSENESLSYAIAGLANSVTISGDGSRMFVTLHDGGVEVISITPSGLATEAILADATGPISADAADGRIVTGSQRQQNQVLVWDSATWLPVGSSQIPSVSNRAITQAATDAFGDSAVIAGDDGVFVIELAIASLPRVQVVGENNEFQFGVRQTGPNSAPRVETFSIQDAVEDEPAFLDLSEGQNIKDVEGDALWYTVSTVPEEGQLERLPDGTFQYLPSENFNGDDQATLRVHDGQSSTDFVVHWDVEAVNDPPVGVHVQLQPLMEDAKHGTQVGFLSVLDADDDANYLFSSSDSRFEVINGQIVFADGELDYETEPEIDLLVTATDSEQSSHVIQKPVVVKLRNANEPPTSLSIEIAGIDENQDGALIGTVAVNDPDHEQTYVFETSDNRFEVVEGKLKLVDGVSIDHEYEPEVALTISAFEAGNRDYGVSAEATVVVKNVNEAPTELLISSNSIEAEKEGAVVGTVSVVDPDKDDVYEFEVTDGRFEVQNGLLRLRDGISIEEGSPPLNLLVLATAGNGDRISGPIPLVVTPPRSPYQNPNNHPDVNRDGYVTPLDALIVLNMLNEGAELPAGGPGSGEPPSVTPDVNGDNRLSPVDLLLIINRLNNGAPGAEGEAFDAEQFVSFPIEQWQRERSAEIDAELETLLAQLAAHRLVL